MTDSTLASKPVPLDLETEESGSTETANSFWRILKAYGRDLRGESFAVVCLLLALSVVAMIG